MRGKPGNMKVGLGRGRSEDQIGFAMHHETPRLQLQLPSQSSPLHLCPGSLCLFLQTLVLCPNQLMEHHGKHIHQIRPTLPTRLYMSCSHSSRQLGVSHALSNEAIQCPWYANCWHPRISGVWAGTHKRISGQQCAEPPFQCLGSAEFFFKSHSCSLHMKVATALRCLPRLKLELKMEQSFTLFLHQQDLTAKRWYVPQWCHDSYVSRFPSQGLTPAS